MQSYLIKVAIVLKNYVCYKRGRYFTYRLMEILFSFA